MTERMFVEAGIGGDLRVLDIGCGLGDVSFLLSKLLSDKAQIVGVDSNESILEIARERAKEEQISNIAFEAIDLSSIPKTLGTFDAIVGRRVLMYLPKPAETISALANMLVPGGRFAFQEHDATMTPGRTAAFPLHDRLHRWMWETVRREGGNPHLGFDLWTLISDAELKVENIRAQGIVITPSFSHPLANIARAMLPRFLEHNVATEEEIDIDTLESRLAEEMTSANTTYVTDMAFCVWGRKAE
ncbi:MAG: methyltransferase domain-containing protein [Leptolyngbya sp.]|nr:methyltransferase domain-containing protein [Candidatus Melainabacteria bacterium]